jgi:ribosomal protein L24
MVVFLVFLSYNKIISIEIKIHLSKVIIINFSQMKKIKSKSWIANK